MGMACSARRAFPVPDFVMMAERVGFEPDACDGWGREGTSGAVLDATPLKTLILNWRRDLLS